MANVTMPAYEARITKMDKLCKWAMKTIVPLVDKRACEGAPGN
jgi:hypothetical protein